MKSFRTFLESFDSRFDYHKVDHPGDHEAHEAHRYSFKDEHGNKKHVDIHHYDYSHGTTGEVYFHDDKQYSHDEYKYSATGNHGHSAIKTFSTVAHIMKHHAKENPHLKKYEFSSDKDEPTRAKLYSRMTKHLDGKTIDHDHLFNHVVDADKLRKA